MCYEQIKPCPFCGGDAYLNSRYISKWKRYMVFVKCDICGGQGKVYSSWEPPAETDWNNDACYSALNAWNRRFNNR